MFAFVSRRVSLILGFTFFLLNLSSASAAQLGIFEDHGDVGTVLHAGEIIYDAGNWIYTISGSGENMWAGVDDFHFAWKKVSGDVLITADILFIETTEILIERLC